MFAIVIVWSPVPLSVAEVTLKLSLNPKEDPFKFAHTLFNPCCKLVVVEPPSATTDIDDALDAPFSISIAISDAPPRVCIVST